MKSTPYLLLVTILVVGTYVVGKRSNRKHHQPHDFLHGNQSHKQNHHHSQTIPTTNATHDRRNHTQHHQYHLLLGRTKIINGTLVKSSGPFKRRKKERRKNKWNKKKFDDFHSKYFPCQNNSLCSCGINDELIYINCYNLTILKSLVDVVQLVSSSYPNRTINHLFMHGCTFEIIPNDFLTGTSIQQLVFYKSYVETIAPHAFRGIHELYTVILKVLNMASFPDVFRTAAPLRVVRVQTSNVSELDTQLANLTSLQVVSLDRNNLIRIHPDAFQHLEHLKSLDLSHNRLTYLDPGIFRHLFQINSLSLQGNLLKHLNGVLDPVHTTIESLILAYNQFESLDGVLYKSTARLRVLDVSHNRLTAIRVTDFKNKVPQLRQMFATDNSIEVLEQEVFQTIFSLEELDIRRNNLSDFSPRTFSHLQNFKRIKLDGNRITKPGEILQFSSNLKIVWLNQNQISDIATTFNMMPQVEDLSVGNNQITIIVNNTFINNRRLRYLNLPGNQISCLELDAFKGLSSLSKLVLSQNRLRDLGGALYHLKIVKTLWISGNLLTKVTENDFPKRLIIKKLSLQDNRLTDVSGAFRNLKSIWLVNLVNNSIRILAEGTFSEQTELKLLYIHANPLECDCRLGWLLKMFHRKNIAFPKFAACTGPARLQNKQLRWLKTRWLYEWPEGCPDGCDCFCQPNGTDYFIYVNCTRKNFREIPLSYPDKTVLLNFSHNALERVPSNLSSLLPSLLDLDLEDNFITSLQGVVLPLTLDKLRLASNKMSSFDAKAAVGNRSLALATMSHNPWKCDCSISNFRTWLLKNSRAVLDINDTRCSSEGRNTFRKRAITSLTENDICPVEIAVYAIVIIVVLGGLLSAASLFIGYVRYKMPIKVWLYSKGLSCIKQEDFDEGKDFDAFLSFSHEDFHVASEIARRLETDHPYYKLCLHYRDFPGGNMIMDNVLWAVKSSKKIIVLLSSNFLNGDWTLFEFQAAHHLMLEEKINRIIVVLLGELPPSDQIRPDIQAYLTSTTYLKWEDRYLWEKLLYAMPKVARENRMTIFEDEDMEHLLLTETL